VQATEDSGAARMARTREESGSEAMAENTGQARQRKLRKAMIGVVTAAHKTPKTITVRVQYLARHPKYGKYLRRATSVRAHDEASAARPGDRVELMECRPMSKTKRWRLVRVVESAPQE
jgi:small subunit ribosomal protein S17